MCGILQGAGKFRYFNLCRRKQQVFTDTHGSARVAGVVPVPFDEVTVIRLHRECGVNESSGLVQSAPPASSMKSSS